MGYHAVVALLSAARASHAPNSPTWGKLSPTRRLLTNMSRLTQTDRSRCHTRKRSFIGGCKSVSRPNDREHKCRLAIRDLANP